jgi:hypothetical protein
VGSWAIEYSANATAETVIMRFTVPSLVARSVPKPD